ncbi:hypothetical protein Daus18300_001172 [Diaporthe australafricana]|uniref:Uncharacterized protein n=1 Tax=Diaporthe australafricana TaxID=127596 RepID=A0ABR3XZC8_9PEZI
MESVAWEDARNDVIGPCCELRERIAHDIVKSLYGMGDSPVDKNKRYDEDGVDDSQPQGDEDADGVEVGSVELGDKQKGALEALKKSVRGLSNAFLQGEDQEVEELGESGWLAWS